MRFRRALLSRRVNAGLEFRYTAPGLTSFAGLELIRRYLSALDLRQCLRDGIGRSLPATDYGLVPMTLLLLALLRSTCHPRVTLNPYAYHVCDAERRRCAFPSRAW